MIFFDTLPFICNFYIKKVQLSKRELHVYGESSRKNSNFILEDKRNNRFCQVAVFLFTIYENSTHQHLHAQRTVCGIVYATRTVAVNPEAEFNLMPLPAIFNIVGDRFGVNEEPDRVKLHKAY